MFTLRSHLLLLCFFILNEKRSCAVSLYTLPSQTQDQFNNFLLKFRQFLSGITSCNPSFVLTAGDFGGERIQKLNRALKLKDFLVHIC